MAYAYVQKRGNQPEGWLSVVFPETEVAHWQIPHFNWAAGMEELRVCVAQDPTVLVLGRTIGNSRLRRDRVVLATKSPGFSGGSWVDFCIACEVEGGNGVIHGSVVSVGDGIKHVRE
jgi:hypothetical protein